MTDLNWKNEAPLTLRPFKPTYHLTMALENMTLNEMIAVDETYESRIHLRRQILRDHPSTMGVRPGGEAAVYEFYEWMTAVYLPQRFPTMYSLGEGEKGSHLYNRATEELIPLRPTSVQEALQTLGAHVDTDFLFLQRSSEDDKYHLEAFQTCFPNGFSSFEKLGQPLAEIHKPVPGYAAKLEKSMDRFFANLAVGKIVKRSNWSITTNDVLYAEAGNHLYAEDETPDEDTKDERTGSGSSKPSLADEISRQRDEVSVLDCRVRCERQTLHRLPKTGALVFGVKTYLYTLSEIKAEGSAEELACAIEGLGKGNVPEMEFYKRGVIWGEKVKKFLRS